MKKTVINVSLGEGLVRSKVRLEGIPCKAGQQQSFIEQFHMLTKIVEDPSLTACSLVPFQKLSMYHNGTCWVVEAEAVLTKEQAGALKDVQRTADATQT